MKSAKQKKKDLKSAAGLLEDAIELLRDSPGLLSIYYIGSLPFILALIFFWTDMLMNAFAFRRLAAAALGVSICFVWMKAWQSVYTARVIDKVKGEASSSGFKTFVASLITQTAIQPWGFIILPVAMVLTVPFGKAYAFFQNATVEGGANGTDIREVMRKSSDSADYDQKQNFILIWLASPFQLVVIGIFIFVLVPIINLFGTGMPPSAIVVISLFVMLPLCPLGIIAAFNIGVSLYLVPVLAKMLFDFETPFSLSGSTIDNTTFFALVWGLVYLTLDPVLKASYALRCFNARSLHTGEDILVWLRRSRKAALPVIACFIMLIASPSHSYAASSKAGPSVKPEQAHAVNPEKLDKSIESVLSRPEYTWKMPRVKPARDEKEDSFLVRTIRSAIESVAEWITSVAKWIKKAMDWVRKLFPSSKPRSPDFSGAATYLNYITWGVIILALAAIAFIIGLLLYRYLKERKPREAGASPAPASVPDISSDEVLATDLHREGWLEMAFELMGKGEYRLSLRAYYLSILAFLSDNRLIVIAKSKSDTDYIIELRHRLIAEQVNSEFLDCVRIFQRSWYGMHDVDIEILDNFNERYKRIRENAKI